MIYIPFLEIRWKIKRKINKLKTQFDKNCIMVSELQMKMINKAIKIELFYV